MGVDVPDVCAKRLWAAFAVHRVGSVGGGAGVVEKRLAEVDRSGILAKIVWHSAARSGHRFGIVATKVTAEDRLVALHIPLFTSWLREVMSTGTRFLMIIDAPDDLELLLAPKGLKEAVVHAHERLAATNEIRVVSDAGTDLTYSCGDYPVMSQWGFSDEPGHFDHWGVGHTHTFPNEGSANGAVVMAPGDIVILPYCRYVQDEVHLEIRDGFVRKVDGGLDAQSRLSLSKACGISSPSVKLRRRPSGPQT